MKEKTEPTYIKIQKVVNGWIVDTGLFNGREGSFMSIDSTHVAETQASLLKLIKDLTAS